jgi:hypothetical protein
LSVMLVGDRLQGHALLSTDSPFSLSRRARGTRAVPLSSAIPTVPHREEGASSLVHTHIARLAVDRRQVWTSVGSGNFR